MRRGAPLFPRWLTALLVLGAAGAVLYALRGVVTPVISAFLIAYLLDPVVDRIEARGVKRDVAITLLLGGLLSGIVLFLVLVVPGIVRDVRAFFVRLPEVVYGAVATYGPRLEALGVPVPHSTGEIVARLGADGASFAQDAIRPVTSALGFVVGGTASALGAVAGALMIPVFAFYLLHDFDRMVAAARDLVPLRHRDAVVTMVREIDAVLGQFVRGQLIVMLALAVLFAVGYGVVGIRLALPIGILAGLLSFIPYVGAGAALALGLLMVAFDGLGLGAALGVVGVYTAIQLLEGFVITPRVVGDKVGLSSVGVLFALMVGGEVFGFLGVLLAVPAAAVLKIFVVRGIERYKASAAYLGEDGAGAGAGAGADTDAVADADTVADADADADAESDADADADADSDGDADADAVADAESDAESDTDGDAVAGSDSLPPAAIVEDPEGVKEEGAGPSAADAPKKAPTPVEC